MLLNPVHVMPTRDSSSPDQQRALTHLFKILLLPFAPFPLCDCAHLFCIFQSVTLFKFCVFHLLKLVKALSLCSCLCVRADFSYSIVFFFFSCLCFPSLPSSLFSQFLVRFPGIWSVLVVFVPVKEVLHFASIPLDFSLTVNPG